MGQRFKQKLKYEITFQLPKFRVLNNFRIFSLMCDGAQQSKHPEQSLVVAQ